MLPNLLGNGHLSGFGAVVNAWPVVITEAVKCLILFSHWLGLVGGPWIVAVDSYECLVCLALKEWKCK